MPCTCSEFSSQAACAIACAGVGALAITFTGQVLVVAPVVMHQRCWDLRWSPIFCSQTQKSEPMKMGTEAVKLLLLVAAISIESFWKETYCQLTVDNNDLKRKKLLCVAEVPRLCVVHSIMTRVLATVRVEGTATSNEVVIV